MATELDPHIARLREQVVDGLKPRVLDALHPRAERSAEDVVEKIYGSPQQDELTYSLVGAALRDLVATGQATRRYVSGAYAGALYRRVDR